MANQIEGVTDKLIKVATEEFLNRGYQNASLRHIAEEAGTSTNSVYVRFQNKEGLFRSIVSPVAEGFIELYIGEMNAFENNHPNMPYLEMMEYTCRRCKILVDYVYEHYDCFKLLICSSQGTELDDFIHTLAEVEAEATLHYMQAIQNTAFSSGIVSLQMLHMASSAYLSGFFEIVKHNMTRKEADNYVIDLQNFFQAGWKDIFNKN